MHAIIFSLIAHLALLLGHRGDNAFNEKNSLYYHQYTEQYSSPSLNAQLITGETGNFSAPSAEANQAPPEKAGVAASNNTESRSRPGIASPVLETEITPVYPIHLLAGGVRGSVSAIFKIRADGAATDIKVVFSQPPGAFDQSLITALSQARFISGSFRSAQVYHITIDFDPGGLQAISPIRQAN